jgi:hypothetical protein
MLSFSSEYMRIVDSKYGFRACTLFSSSLEANSPKNRSYHAQKGAFLFGLYRTLGEKIKSKRNFNSHNLVKDCQHLTLSVMRSGPDVSAYCTKCWKLIFKTKEAVVWKYSLASTFKNEDPKCQGKIAKLYRTDRYVTARCMTCDYHVRASELKIERGAVVNPRIEPVKSVWKISS